MKRIMIAMILLVVAKVQAYDLDPHIKSGKLNNGVQYQVVEGDFNNNFLRVAMLVKTGGMDEIGTSGVAHATEHMVFSANKTYPQGVHQYLKSVGLEIGRDFNAATGDTFTQFKFRVNPKHPFALNETLKMLKAIATDALMTTEDWKNEKKIIVEELRQTSSVQGLVSARTRSILRSDQHDVGNTLGTHDDILSITAEQVKAYYKRRYNANNIEIIVAGNQNIKATINNIEAVFNTLQTVDVEDRSYQNFPLDDGFIKKLIQIEGDSVTQSDLYFRAIRASVSDDPELQMIDNILVSMLQTLTILDKKDQKPVLISLTTLTPKRVALHFSARPDKKADKVNDDSNPIDLGTQKILRAIQRLQRHGLSQELLNQGKEKYLENLTFKQQTAKNRQPIDWVRSIISNIVTETEFVDLNDPKIVTSLQNIKLEQVQKRLNYYLNSNEKVLLYRVPKQLKVTLPSEQLLATWVKQLEGENLDLSEQLNKQIEADQVVLKQSNLSLSYLKAKLNLTAQKPISLKSNNGLIEWHYANGNKVVYLNMPTSDNKLLASLVGQSGALNSTMPYWLATETFKASKYNAPSGFNIESWMKWKKNNQLVIWNSLDAYSTKVKIQANPSKLEHALAAYYTQALLGSLSQEDLVTIKESHQQTIANASAINSLRFGGENPYLAGDITLESVTVNDMHNTFNRLLHQPKVLFILGEADLEKLQQVTDFYLGGEQTTAALDHYQPKVYRGVAKTIKKSEIGVQPVTHVAILNQTNYQWKPELAYFIYGVEVVASRAISNKLRDQLGKVYSPYLSIQTTPETNKVDIYLFFDSKPEDAQALAKLALKILDNLESEFTVQDVAKFKHDIAQVTEDLNKVPEPMKLKRLQQSYFARGDASYLLKDTPTLAQRITLPLLKKTYHDVWHNTNTFISYSTEK